MDLGDKEQRQGFLARQIQTRAFAYKNGHSL